MYSIRIRYGLNNPRQIFTTEKELKRAFSDVNKFEKYINKIDKEVKKDARDFHTNNNIY